MEWLDLFNRLAWFEIQSKIIDIGHLHQKFVSTGALMGAEPVAIFLVHNPQGISVQMLQMKMIHCGSWPFGAVLVSINIQGVVIFRAIAFSRKSYLI